MKQIYSFSVPVSDGKTTEVFFAKPSNSDIEDAEFVKAQKFNQLLQAGFMSRAMMNKKFGDIGGLYSDKENEELGNAILELIEAKRIMEFYGEAKDLDDEQKGKLEDAERTYLAVQQRIAENDSSLREMFNQSADAKAEEYLIKWYVLSCSYFNETAGDKVEAFRIFDKTTLTDKKEQLNQLLEEIEEHDDALTKKKKSIVQNSLVTLTRVATLWYNGLGSNQKEIEDGLVKFFEETPVEEPKKKRAARKKTKTAAA